MTDFECKNMDMALTALDTIAAGMKGARQAALLAVKTWVHKMCRQDFPMRSFLEFSTRKRRRRGKARHGLTVEAGR